MSKITHYSREGYNGDYTYTSVCGKRVKTKDNENSVVHPEQVNCKDCLKTKEYKTDLVDFKKTKPGMLRRIYIESDILHKMNSRVLKIKLKT